MLYFCITFIYLLGKYLVIIGLLLDIYFLIVNSLVCKKINGILGFNPGKKSIHQVVYWDMYIKTWRNDYYSNRSKLLSEFENYINEDSSKDKLKKYTGSVFNCRTNDSFFIYFIKRLEGKVLIDDHSKSFEMQPLEKLMFINSLVLWKNTLNRDFWKYIFRKETVRNYYFRID